MKMCNKCGILKNEVSFAKDSGKKDGLHSICRSCNSLYMRQYLEINREQILSYQHSHYRENRDVILLRNRERRRKYGEIYNENKRKKKLNNPIPTLLTSARVRARKRGLDFNISEVDVAIPKTCPALGIPLFVSPNNKPCDNSPTIDRIDNTRVI